MLVPLSQHRQLSRATASAALVRVVVHAAVVHVCLPGPPLPSASSWRSTLGSETGDRICRLQTGSQMPSERREGTIFDVSYPMMHPLGRHKMLQ